MTSNERIKNYITDFFLTAIISFFAVTLVNLLYNFIIHNEKSFDWETSFRFSLIFGIVFPFVRYLEKKKQNLN